MALMDAEPTTKRSRSKREPAGQTDTSRVRIITAAEAVFSERGYDAGTIRDVAHRADVPLGLVTYYFPGKLSLYRAVFEARVPEIVQQRLAGMALADLEADPDRRLELLVKALLVPMLGMRGTEGGRRFAVLMAREIADPSSKDRGIIEELMQPVTVTFLTALRNALPEERQGAALWAYGAMMGAMLYMMSGAGRMPDVSAGIVNPDDVRACTEHLVAIALAGFLH